MKQKDIALIVVISFVSAIASFLISNALFAKPEQKTQQAEVVEAISAEFPEADNRYFNKDAVNPTQPITIGNSANPTPFTGSGQ